MKTSEKEDLKNKIKEEINNTSEIIKKYTKLCKPIPPENSIGRVSRMDAINNKSVVEAALHESKIKLKQLNIIQRNISNNTDFGRCLKCKKTIPFQRLIIRPESMFCVNCAK
jgi:DnaK suppressor protein